MKQRMIVICAVFIGIAMVAVPEIVTNNILEMVLNILIWMGFFRLLDEKGGER